MAGDANDSEAKLVEVVEGNEVTLFVYDADGNRLIRRDAGQVVHHTTIEAIVPAYQPDPIAAAAAIAAAFKKRAGGAALPTITSYDQRSAS